MHARAVQTFTFFFLAISTLAAASPAPIDPQLANVIAENRNAACTGPSGCVGASGTIAAASEANSAAARSVTVSSGAVVAIVALAGLL